MKLESENKIARRICDLMYAERKAKKISQQKLCESLGITQGLLSKIENQKLQPSVYVWLTFCRIFGLSSEIAMSETNARKRLSVLKKKSEVKAAIVKH
jgi:transcriptional regulator with XRE-family HTH domain